MAQLSHGARVGARNLKRPEGSKLSRSHTCSEPESCVRTNNRALVAWPWCHHNPDPSIYCMDCRLHLSMQSSVNKCTAHVLCCGAQHRLHSDARGCVASSVLPIADLSLRAEKQITLEQKLGYQIIFEGPESLGLTMGKLPLCWC